MTTTRVNRAVGKETTQHGKKKAMDPPKFKYELVEDFDWDDYKKTLEESHEVTWQGMKQQILPKNWALLEKKLGYATKGSCIPRLSNAKEVRFLSSKYRGRRCYICQHYGGDKGSYMFVAKDKKC